MNNPSDIEKLWTALAAKFGNGRTWHQLETMEQHTFIQGVNMIMQVVGRTQ